MNENLTDRSYKPDKRSSEARLRLASKGPAVVFSVSFLQRPEISRAATGDTFGRDEQR